LSSIFALSRDFNEYMNYLKEFGLYALVGLIFLGVIILIFALIL